LKYFVLKIRNGLELSMISCTFCHTISKSVDKEPKDI